MHSSPEDLTRQVVELISKTANGTANIGPTTNLLLDLDIDSLALIDLITALENKYGVVLFNKDTGYRDMETVETLVALILSRRAANLPA